MAWLIHLPTEGHLGYFQVLAIMNNTIINRPVTVGHSMVFLLFKFIGFIFIYSKGRAIEGDRQIEYHLPSFGSLSKWRNSHDWARWKPGAPSGSPLDGRDLSI